MKRMFLILTSLLIIIIVMVVLCAPLIERYDPGLEYHSVGYANAKGIMQGLCLGDIEETYDGMVYKAEATPDLAEKLKGYRDLVDGRLYTHIATVEFTLEGDYPEAPWSETSYVEIMMDDGSTLYAIVVFLQNADGCGITDFDLFAECPWE